MKLKYGDAVKIIDEFYGHLEGTVLDYHISPKTEGLEETVRYFIRIHTMDGLEVKRWIPEKLLERRVEIDWERK